MPKQKLMTKTDKMSVKRRILVLCATEIEVLAVKNGMGSALGCLDVRFAVSGMGVVATAAELVYQINDFSPEIIINAGICGAVSKELAFGEVVEVVSETVADLGAIRPDGFVKFDTPIYIGANKLQLPFKKVNGATVSTACGGRTDGFDTESMEGAAVFAICQRMEIEVVQLRAVSNYIDTPREQWNIQGALKSLGEAMAQMVAILQ